jgi:hypothetical protein
LVVVSRSIEYFVVVSRSVETVVYVVRYVEVMLVITVELLISVNVDR